jgi:hypothetical protein
MGTDTEARQGRLRRIALNETLSALLDYWRSKCRGRPMPARTDIDPAEIPALLPYLMLLDMPKGRIRYRLAGEVVEREYGLALAGKHVEDVVPRQRLAFALSTYDKVIESGRPLVCRSNFITPNGLERVVTRLILPLADEGETMMILVGLQFPPVGHAPDPLLGIETVIEGEGYEYEYV